VLVLVRVLAIENRNIDHQDDDQDDEVPAHLRYAA
jgi:hypothetical protein